MGLHRLWLWSLCWRHCLHWLLNQFEPVQISNKESFHIFSDSKYAKRLNSAVSDKYLYLLTTSSCVNRVGDFVEPEPFEKEIKENRKSQKKKKKKKKKPKIPKKKKKKKKKKK